MRATRGKCMGCREGTTGALSHSSCMIPRVHVRHNFLFATECIRGISSGQDGTMGGMLQGSRAATRDGVPVSVARTGDAGAVATSVMGE